LKQLLIIIFATFIFVGCSPKNQTVNIKLPSNNDIGVEIQKDKDALGDPIKPIDTIDPLEEVTIIENEMPIINNSEVMKLAVIYPSKVIGKYAKSSMNTILGYLDYKKVKYQIKVFDTSNETPENVENSFRELKNSGFENVIALFTPRVLDLIHTLDTSGLKVYLPLTHKDSVSVINDNFIYGAISYTNQIEKLLEYSNTNNAMFYQNSFLGNKLKSKYEALVDNLRVVKEIKKKRNYFKGIVRDYRLRKSTLFLNTTIVKTSILLSQLRAYDIYPKVILSTQLNYNPKILSLTQSKDRRNFVVANSIAKVDDNLQDTISTFGGNIVYNWVDYSTLVGINYLYDENESDLLETQVIDNQVSFEPKLFRTTAYGFLEIK
jgi:hypothetical protein